MDVEGRRLLFFLFFSTLCLSCSRVFQTVRVRFLCGNSSKRFSLYLLCTDIGNSWRRDQDACGHMIEACTGPDSLIKTCWGPLTLGSSKDECVWMCPHLNICIALLHLFAEAGYEHAASSSRSNKGRRIHIQTGDR